MHIPKCGGTAIDIAIRNSYGLYENLRGRALFTENHSALLKASSIDNETVENYRKKLQLYYLSNGDCKYISGHFRYSEKAMQEFGKYWNFITILRHPVFHWFSVYFFNRYKTSPHFKINQDLESFIESENAARMGSSYIWRLTDHISWSEAACDTAINQAIENLDKFSLVGVLERMNIFKKDYENLFGAKLIVQMYNKNPLSKSQQKEQITDEIKSRVEEICQPNMKMYESVMQKINKYN
ncbi:MAG: hypothetical protein WBA93_18060 [Microcoleaceae cyanobacterium]